MPNKNELINSKDKNYLLVCVKEYNSDLIQLLLQLAVYYRIPAYSYKGSKAAFVFDKSYDAIDEFETSLQRYPYSVKTIKYNINRY